MFILFGRNYEFHVKLRMYQEILMPTNIVNKLLR